MKKLLLLALISAASASVFAPRAAAEFRWRIYTDLRVSLVSWTVPLGEKAEKYITLNNQQAINILGNNPESSAGTYAGISGINRGNYIHSSGALDFFNATNTIPSVSQSIVGLFLEYRTPSVMFYTRVPLNNLFRITSAQNSFVQYAGRNANWVDFLRLSFEEWYIRGNFGVFAAYIGNTGDTGKVREYNSFSHEILESIKIDNLGVLTPELRSATISGQTINNLAYAGQTRTANTGGTFDPYRPFLSYLTPRASLAVRTEPFGFPLTVQFAVDAGDTNLFDVTENYRNYSGAIRVSGENVFKRITFDAVYKLRGGDPDITDAYDANGSHIPPQPDGKGVFVHQFGLYANILNVPKFNFTLGYGGYVKSFEDTQTGSQSSPLFSGIDLRLVYTVVNGLSITSHNNVSFARAKKRTDDNMAVNLWGTPFVNNDTEQNWFALYNALNIRCRLSRQFTATLQIANRLGIVTTSVSTENAAAYDVVRTHNLLGGGGLLYFYFNSNLSFMTGLGFRYQYDAYSNSAQGAQDTPGTRDASGGVFGIAMPFRIRVNFRP